MVGGTVGEVIASNDPNFKAGDMVVGCLGWQLYGVATARTLQQAELRHNFPLSLYLGAVGMPGVTAWIGLLQDRAAEGAARPSSSARPPARSARGRAAREAAGLPRRRHRRRRRRNAPIPWRISASTAASTTSAGHIVPRSRSGHARRHRHLFRECRRRRAGRRAPAPQPISPAFPLCGLISDYNSTEPRGIPDLRQFLFKRMKLQGFICSDTLEVWPEAIRQLEGWISSRQDAQVSRDHRRRPRERAPGLHRPVQRRELRQADREAAA